MTEAQVLASIAFLYGWSAVMIVVLLRDIMHTRREIAALRAAAAAPQSFGGSSTSAQTGT